MDTDTDLPYRGLCHPGGLDYGGSAHVAGDSPSYTAQRLAPKENGLVLLAGSSLPLPEAVAMDEFLNPVSTSLRDQIGRAHV